MKQLTKHIEQFFFGTCTIFTLSMALYAAYAAALSRPMMEIREVLLILLVASVLSLLRVFCYSEWLFKKWGWLARTCLLFVLSVGTVPLILPLFGVTLISSPHAITMYLLIFTLLFFGMLGVFEVIYRLQGKHYDVLLHKQQMLEKQQETP